MQQPTMAEPKTDSPLGRGAKITACGVVTATPISTRGEADGKERCRFELDIGELIPLGVLAMGELVERASALEKNQPVQVKGQLKIFGWRTKSGIEQEKFLLLASEIFQ